MFEDLIDNEYDYLISLDFSNIHTQTYLPFTINNFKQKNIDDKSLDNS